MKVNTALILCAGFGKRLSPLTLKNPKPLLQLRNNVTMLEDCINLIIKLDIKKVLLNTFHLGDQLHKFVKDKNFQIDIQIIDDGKEILNTGGGILNMMNYSNDDDFLIFNPDTVWSEKYINEISKMQSLYFSNKFKNCLLVVKKSLSFDKSLKGDFELKNNLLIKNARKEFIYIGCQILNRSLLKQYRVTNFSISEIWSKLLNKNELMGFESLNDFYHLTNLEIFKKLKDS